MFPDILSIGPLTIHTYGLMVATGFVVGLIVTIKAGKSEGFSSQQIMDMGFIIILAAIIGSRLMYILMNISYYKENLLEAVEIWHGGLVFSGGVIAVIISMSFYLKKHDLSFWKTGDLFAPAAAIGQAIGRIGCLMAGCCYGRPTSSILGVTFTHPHSLAPTNIPLHPTQIYSSLSGFIIFCILLVLKSKKKFDGQVLIWFLILHSTSRLAIERFRGDDRGTLIAANMSVTQLVAITLLIVSVILLFWRKPKTAKT